MSLLRKIELICLMFLITAYGAATYQRNSVWQTWITLWSDVAKKSPQKARPYYNLGFIYLKQGLIDKAITENRKALRLRHSYMEARFNLASAYGLKGLTDLAIIELQKVVKLAPYNADVYYNLGIAFNKKGMYKQAVQMFEKGVELKPDDAEAHLELVNLYLYKIKDRKKALFHYKKSKDLGAKN